MQCRWSSCDEEYLRARGLCHKHYKAASRAVASGRSTWSELVRLGLARAPQFKPAQDVIDARRKQRRKQT